MTDQPPDPLRQFMIAAHFNLEGVKAGLKDHPEWLTIDYDWGEQGGRETPLGAAAHVGGTHLAQYLLGCGAPLTPAAAAMLGLRGALEAFIDADPANANVPGAHGIPLLAHAAFSGDVELVEMLKARGNTLAGVSMGLINAVSAGHAAMAAWMLANGADASAKNYQGKSALDIAEANGFTEIVTLLKNHP
ncbi:MAG: ankyrin repeat domain-containing protein [Chloroflexi bacterium]|nr:ankyrin repeat domain-containing protein [Chloroflexota bacterium]